MANLEIIKHNLPEELWETAMKFDIPDIFLEKESDLVILVLKSRSLAKDEEKQSWFNLVPMMNEDQINKLRDILNREKNKIAEIETKYENKKEEIKEKYKDKFDAVEYQRKMSNMQTNEENIREKENEEAENLLKNL